MRNTIFSGTGIAREAADTIRQLLPAGWDLEIRSFGQGRPDATLELEAPDGSRVFLLVEAKKSLDARDVPRLVGQLRSYVESFKPEGASFVVVSPYLGPRTREMLAKEGVSYADTTGNLWISLQRPAVFIRATGRDSNPWPDQRPLRSLKGPAAGRVVRALCDFRPPYGVRELAERSGTAPASVSRVIDLLAREALLSRERRGRVLDVQWPDLIRRWTRDYGVLTANRAQTFLAPRGLPDLLAGLANRAVRYAVTGSLAAVQRAPLAPAQLAMVYVEDAVELAQRLQLRPAETAGNVILLEPFDPVVFDRTWTSSGTTFAAISQVAADLLTAPGRAPSEGEELLMWMEENEADWRTA